MLGALRAVLPVARKLPSAGLATQAAQGPLGPLGRSVLYRGQVPKPRGEPGKIRGELGKTRREPGKMRREPEKTQREPRTTQREPRTTQREPRTARATQKTRADGTGFVKIGTEEQARMTLTPKAQEARAKWGQSKERQTQLRGRLRDASLAGWQRRKIELRLKLGSDAQWAPEKKIATSSMEKIRLLNAEFPKEWTLPRLADQFRISQESIRRILKSRFRPSLAQAERRESRRKEQRSQFQKSVSPGST